MYIVGVYDPPGLFAYLGDYTNDPNSPDPPKRNAFNDLTLAMNWLYRKRSFAISDPTLIVYSSTSLSRTKPTTPDPTIDHIDLLGIVQIEFLDRPPPFSIDLDKFPDLKADVLASCDSDSDISRSLGDSIHADWYNGLTLGEALNHVGCPPISHPPHRKDPSYLGKLAKVITYTTTVLKHSATSVLSVIHKVHPSDPAHPPL
jgi:hypothetical protein